VSDVDEATDDDDVSLSCRYDPRWSAERHSQLVRSMASGGKLGNSAFQNTPDLIATGAGEGNKNVFQTQLLLVKNTEWVRNKLRHVFFDSIDGPSDAHAFNAFFDYHDNPGKVKVLPSCTGALSRFEAVGPHRYQYGDFISLGLSAT
jgi:hypothetical protein